MKVDKAKNERQRQLGNVQKQLLNNYFLEKYSNIMNKISNKPEIVKTPISKEVKPVHNKKNFKSIMLQKKNQIQNSPFEKLHLRQSSHKQTINEKIFQWSKKSDQKKLDTNIDEKTRQQLQQSIVNDLYHQSPTKLQSGFYNIVQVQKNTSSISMPTPDQQITQIDYNEVINVTYDSQVAEQNIQQEDEEHKQYEQAIRQEIKRQFSNRKSRKSSPRKSSPKKSLDKYKQSQAKSSKVSVQIHIQSPKGIHSHNKFQTQLQKQREQPEQNYRSHFDQIEETETKQQNQLKGPQIHYNRQSVHPLKLHQSQNFQPENSNIEQGVIQFIAPSSNYYKSENPNFVEDTFRYQQKTNSQKDDFQEQIPQKFANHLLQKDPSKKSFRSGSKDHNSGKDSSQIQMSFISRLSLMSSQEGLNIKTAIEKQLYQNEFGPYQSGLYSVLDLIQKNRKSGPVYAVAQRTLDDRRTIQSRKRQQAFQIQELQRKIQYLKNKNEVVKFAGYEQSIIRKNKLQILRLVRKLGSKL